MGMNAFQGLAVSRDISQIFFNTGDLGALRPWIDDDNRVRVTLGGHKPPEKQEHPVVNATSTMRKEDWLALDGQILKVAKERLKLVGDLNASGLVFSIANGMGKTVFQTERASDISEATASMDPIRESEKDRPVYDFVNLPLPIVHKDFEFTMRQLMVSRNSDTPLDTSTGERAARRVAELVERFAIGSETFPTFGGGTIYGLVNFPSANTYDVVAPTETGWVGATTLADLLAMRQAAISDKYYGPYMVFVSTDWDKYLDGDFSTAKGDLSLRERLKMVSNILDIRTLDYLTAGYKMILVQWDTDTIRMVNGIALTTLQWEEKGGMLQKFKVLTQQVPQVRADQNGNCGIVYGVPA
jgi:hypothetical protein